MEEIVLRVHGIVIWVVDEWVGIIDVGKWLDWVRNDFWLGKIGGEEGRWVDNGLVVSPCW